MFDKAIYSSDKYQYTMGKVMWVKGNDGKQAVFDVFFRKTPDYNGWAVVAGIKQVVELIKTLNCNDYTLEDKYSMFFHLFQDSRYALKLANLKFTGKVFAMEDGEIAFPNEPILRIEGPLLEAQILETPILSIINHAMLVATKASRIYRAAQGIPVSALGSRRAHGIWSAIYGDEAAYIGGCTNVSNIMTEMLCGVPSIGTMSHSFIESYGVGKEAEYQAFRDFVEVDPVRSNILLVDTYNVEKSGLPNAIKVFQEFDLENQSKLFNDTYGIRLDSGNLCWQSIYCRKKLNEAGFYNAKIIATNGLDEYSIANLIEQGAQIDAFGVGDAIATSKHDPCFGGVYKLAEIDGIPVIKLSEDKGKTINPGRKNVMRITQNGKFIADMIYLEDEKMVEKFREQEPKEITINNNIAVSLEENLYVNIPLKNYTCTNLLSEVDLNRLHFSHHYACNAKKYFLKNLASFDKKYILLKNPKKYKVTISKGLYNLKNQLIQQIEESLDD